MKDRPLCIRPATPDDIKVMTTLLKELFDLEPDFHFKPVKQRAGLRRLIKDPNAAVFVAERDSLVVGMCTVQMVISTAEGGRSGWVEDLVVHNKFRGQGIGRELLAAAETWAEDHKLSRLQLLADSRNGPALDFYLSQGWDNTSLVCRRKSLKPVR